MTPNDAAAILTRLDKQDEVLAEIKVQAKITNGRVTELERQQLRREERELMLKEFAKDLADGQSKRAATFRWRVAQTIALAATAAGVLAASHL